MRPLIVSSGPARAPEQVVERVAERIRRREPCSLLELNDRSAEGKRLLAEVKTLARELLAVPDTFEVLLLPGGASQQFAIAAINLRGCVDSATFLLTDYWTGRAQAEFANFLPTSAVHLSHEEVGGGLVADRAMQGRCAVFLTTNNTASGSRWPKIPPLSGQCRILDMSSDLFACKPDFGRADLIIAAGQKNFGVAGLSVVLARNSLLERLSCPPGVFSYRSWLQAGGMYNTFPVVSLAITHEYLQYICDIGGVEAAGENCSKCSDALYDFLDGSKNFEAPVPRPARSPHNVVFKTRSEVDTAALLERAEARQIIGLKGHPSVGGLRASFYVGADIGDARQLIEFLGQFE